MPLSEDTQHNLLFIIIALLFILFSTGMATPVAAVPVIIAPP